jgi:hypothetical protein
LKRPTKQSIKNTANMRARLLKMSWAKKRADAGLAKKLHGMRPGYAASA